MTKRRIDKEVVAARLQEKPKRRRKKPPGNRAEREAMEYNWWALQRDKKLMLELMNGRTVTGMLKWVAVFSLLLETVDAEILVFKHSIATVQRVKT
jgi:sRNA-binding regulator protein Hfq